MTQFTKEDVYEAACVALNTENGVDPRNQTLAKRGRVKKNVEAALARFQDEYNELLQKVVDEVVEKNLTED